MLRTLVLIVGICLAGCRTDPCEMALATIEGRGGPASLMIPVIGQSASPGRATFAVECIDVLVVSADDYSDTLAVGRGRVELGRVRVERLPVGSADLIVGGGAFFPVKQTSVQIREGRNLLENRLLMYRWESDFHVAGRVSVELRSGSTLDDIRPIYSLFDNATVREEVQGYVIRFTSESSREADVTLQRLCQRLTASPHVVSARPVVDFNLMHPAGA